MKRFVCLLFSLLLLCTGAGAEDWLNNGGQGGAVDRVTDKNVYDAAETAGTVVNATDPGAPSAMDTIMYAYTPVEVVLVVDVSGSMADADSATGKSLLSYAKDAAAAFCHTLYAMNPASRVGLVWYGSSAGVACGMTGAAEQDTLLQAIENLSYADSTNTGGGYEKAVELLSASDMPERRKVFLMLSDGQANTGSSNPERYAVQQGQSAAMMGSVYTIGMVGSLSEESKRATRRVLEAGYQTRYFEVDFDRIANTGIGLTTVMQMIAGSASMGQSIDPATGKERESSYVYISTTGGYEVRVQHASGEYLSNAQGDEQTSASFGTMSEIAGQHTFVLSDGDMTISVQGLSDEEGSLTISQIKGAAMKETVLMRRSDFSSPCFRQTYVMKDGRVEQRIDESYNCLDMFARDDDGNLIRGLSRPASASTKGSVAVKPAPASRTANVAQLEKNSHVAVLAQDLETGWYYISFTDKDGKVSRGWVEENVLADMRGHVHVMVWLEGSYTIGQNTQAMRAPSQAASKAYDVSKGTQVALKHVERDRDGNEWAYVALPSTQGGRFAYVQVETIDGWQTLTAEDYRLGYNVPVPAEDMFFPKINVQKDLLMRVYSAPSLNSWRGARGKAEVSTNGGLYAMGWVNNQWLLVQYGTSIGNRRVGYVHADALKGELPSLPQVVFEPVPATITWECVLTDDPRNASEQITTLRPGAKVSYLASYDNGQLWDYIETKVGGQTVRAFIPQGCLDK